MAIMKVLTNGWDGLHELILFQLEEDGGFSSSIQSESYYTDLHLWTNVDTVVLQSKTDFDCSALHWSKLRPFTFK